MPYVLLSSMVILTVTGQLLVKRGAGRVDFSSVRAVIRTIFNLPIVMAAFLVLIASACYISALSRVDLSVAFIFNGLNYPLVAFAAALFLKERLTRYHIVGTLLILAGFIIFQL